MTRIILTIIIVTLVTVSYAQNRDYSNWKILAQVEYEKSRDKYGEIFVPKFNEKIKSLEGKKITLPGYIIPFQGMFEPKKLIISSLPIASCFFCGSGGPETVAEALMADAVDYTSDPVTIEGTLELNDSDANNLMFRLTEARIIKE